jgi:ABC-2 type transport system ATP-binding protein
MAPSRDLVIQTHDLSKQFNGFTAVDALNLEVPRNTIFGFLGPNGAGKTTTMKCLLGLARPTGGRATLFGLDSRRDSLAVRRRIGYLPQHPRFYDTMTARETLRFTAGLFFDGRGPAIDRRVAEMLALVGLSDRADRPVGGFSGGELQRLGIAQAQINDPDLLILDEPAAALDPLGRRDVLGIMESLRERTTIFYSTHILNDVQQVSDTVAILNRGRLITQGPIAALLAGDGAAVYIVGLRGDTAPARDELARQPWVSAIHESPNGAAEWRVSVTDPAAAEEGLLRAVLAHPGVAVTEFRRQRFALEEVFIDLVEGREA